MAILVKTEFIRKDTVRIICYVYDDDEALVDASSVSVSIKKDTTVEIDTGMNRTDPGTYEYYYTTSTSVSTGVYQIECDILDGSYHTFVHATFNMEAGINE